MATDTAAQKVTLAGRRYVLLPAEDFERLQALAGESDGPTLPEPDAKGRYPAVEYARVSLARKIVRRRRAIGLTQVDLARRAGIRKESLCRIESGKVTPTLTSIEKITRALEKAEGAAEM